MILCKTSVEGDKVDELLEDNVASLSPVQSAQGISVSEIEVTFGGGHIGQGTSLSWSRNRTHGELLWAWILAWSFGY